MKGIEVLQKNKTESPGSKTLTIIAEGVKIEGKIYSKGSTRIDGEVVGEIVSENELIIGREGKVEANINTTNATIAGNFKGEMIVSGEIEITATGKFTGNLTQKDALLTVAKGGIFKGQILISENQDIFKFAPDKSFGASVQSKAQIPNESQPSHSIYTQPQTNPGIGIRTPVRENDIRI
jgi:cytoskeletal protein CcmA (bactofilin family)